MICFVYGSDAYRIERKVSELATEFGRKRDQRGLNLVRLEGATLEIEHLRQEALTMPFLGEKKMIIIAGILSNRKQQKAVLEFLQSAANIDNVLVFVERFADPKKKLTGALFDYLSQTQFSWRYDRLTPIATEKWLASYAQETHIPIDARAVKALIAATGTDLQRLTTELRKLGSYRNGETITSNDVAALVNAATDGHVFKVIDAISAKNRTLTLQLMSQYLDEGNHPLALTKMLSRQFTLLLSIKSFDQNPSTLGRELKLHPFVAQKAAAYAQKFSGHELQAVCDELLQIEQQLKTSYKNPELLFAILIEKIVATN